MNDIARASAYSSDPDLANAITVGRFLNGSPAMLDMKHLVEGHARALGRTRSGKSVFLRSALMQLLMRQTPTYRAFARKAGIDWRPMSFIFATFVKGRDDRERNLFATLAYEAGLPFWSLEPATGEWTHRYSPFMQPFYLRMSVNEMAAHTAACLALAEAEDDNAKYFASKAAAFMVAAEEKFGPFNSYRDYYDFISKEENRRAMGFNERGSDHSSQVVDHVRLMAAVEPLNRETTTIDMEKLLFEPRFLYVNLHRLGDKFGHMIAKQLLFDLKAAAEMNYRARTNHVFFVVDEADILVKARGVVGLFNRIRHCDVSMILSHQYAEQTGDHGVGLDVNCEWTVSFGLPTAESIEKMQADAPDDLQHLLSREVDTRDDDRESIAEAVRTATMRATATEEFAPRYSKNDAIRLNRTGRVGWLRLSHDVGGTKVDGVAPFSWTHSLTREEWDSYADRSEHVPFHEMERVSQEPRERRREPQPLRDRETDPESQEALNKKMGRR
jgi:hypothetical protein